MPPQAQLAVRRWVECGGTLLIHGQSAPAAFSQDGAADGEGSCWVGLGRVIAGLDDGDANWEPTYKKLADALETRSVYQPAEKPGNLTICSSPKPRSPCGDCSPWCCCLAWASGPPICGSSPATSGASGCGGTCPSSPC